MGSEIIIIPAVFFGIYHLLKLISDHFLKRKLIKAGQYERVGILETPVQIEESNKYPSLKWGLVVFMTGLGFILIEMLRSANPYMINYNENAALPIGVLLVFVSSGFLIYFFIMNRKKN